MKEKGFTLIELLAVIIILAVIALIATPIVLNMVEKSKESARKSSVLNYADAVRLTYLEKGFGQINPNLDYKTLTNNIMNNRSVDCELVTYCEKTGAVLSNCKVNNEGEYYFGNGVLVTSKPANMADILACDALLSEDNTGEQKPQIDYEKPNYTCDTNCEDIGIIENVIDKNNWDEYTIYTVGYTTYTGLKNADYNVNIKVDFDTNKYTLEVIDSKVMDSIEDFNKHKELKDKGIISTGSYTDELDAISTPQERKDHSATSNEINIDSVNPSCSGNKCVVNIKESYQNLNVITPHQTITKNGNAISAVYLPIKIKLKLVEKVQIPFDIPKYAFNGYNENAFGDNVGTIDNLQLTEIKAITLKEIDSQTLDYTFEKPGYYRIFFSCHNKEQAGFLSVCYNYFLNISNTISFKEVDNSYPNYGLENGDYENLFFRITKAQTGKTVSIKIYYDKFPDFTWYQLDQNIYMYIYYQEADVENIELEGNFK